MSHGMVRPHLALIVLVATLAGTGSSEAGSGLPQRLGMYPTQTGAAPLAMLDSDIAVRVRGPIVEAIITQTFRNETDRATEATYIFPLPADAAVSAMELEVGTRTIRAAIEAREQAQQRYEDAVAAGLGAGLLEQERPDVFTQTVSAIPAGGTVKVSLRFDTVARYQQGTWELVVPLVIAPRYVPGVASGRPTTGAGGAPDTDRAPDASRITPKAAPGAGGRTDVVIELPDSVDDVTSPTHELTQSGTTYSFTDPKSDHDAIIRWRAKTATQAWAEQGDDGGYAAVLVEAKPAAATRKNPVKVQLVLDDAATSRGDAEAVQRPFARALLGQLQARDRVGVRDGDTIRWGTGSAAQKIVDASWGTKPGAFDLTKTLTSLRGDHPVVLVTAGLVGDDRAAIAAAGKAGAPIHVIGVGPAPNRALLAQIANASGGTVRFPAIGDDLTTLARDVLADAASPPERLAVSWGTLVASDIVPATLPRLGAGQAILVLAKVKKLVTANARVRGDVVGFTAVTPAKPIDGATSTRGTLGRRWARSKLDELVAARNLKAVRDHALRYGLVSPATAMVAIADEVVVKGGVKHTITVPVSVPAGMQWQLVKRETTVETTQTKTKNFPRRENVGDKLKKEAAPKSTGEDENLAEAEDRSTRTLDSVDAAPAPVALAPEPGTASDSDDEEDAVSTIALRESSVLGRGLRLSLSLGGGVAVAGGEAAPLGALAGRLDMGRGRTVAGLEASLWFVDGFNAQGSALATISRRGIARRLEVGGGAGLRITGDAFGPALNVTLRALLPVRGLATYLRYDGALLRSEGVTAGQSAGSLGLEARW